MATDLSCIKTIVDSSQELKLDKEKLGEESYEFFRRLFNGQEEFLLKGCAGAEFDAQHKRLTVRGRFERLFARADVIVSVTLLDCAATGTTEQRHGVFRVTIPKNFTAKSFLSSYCQTSGSEVIQDIRFWDSESMVVSSLDYSKATAEVFYPECGQEFPRTQIGKGINFGTEITPHPHFDSRVKDLFGKGLASSGWSRSLLNIGDGTPILVFENSFDFQLSALKIFTIKLNKVSLALPLRAEGAVDTLMSLAGHVQISRLGFDARAEWYPYHGEFVLAFVFDNFPTLAEMLSAILGSSDRPPIPQLDFDVKLSELVVVADLSDKTISHVQFGIKQVNKFDLIPDVISVEMALDMLIYPPFKRDSVEAVLSGDWAIGNTVVETSFYYPGLDFSIIMDPEEASSKSQALKLGSLVEKFTKKKTFEEAGIPKELWEIALTKLVIEGDFKEKSFSAEIGVDTSRSLAFTVGGHRFGLDHIGTSFGYAHGKIYHWGIGAVLKLAGVEVFLAADWEGGNGGKSNGWTFAGSTGYGQDIKLLALEIKGWKPPKAVESFTIKNLGVSFKTGTNQFSFTCEGSMEVAPGQLLSGTIVVDRDSTGIHASATLIFAGNKFLLNLDSIANQTLLKADWIKESSGPEVNFLTSLGEQYGGSELSGKLAPLSLPKPLSAALVLNLADNSKSLALSCELEFGKEKGALAILVAKDKRKSGWVFAAGLKAPPLSTDKMGALGTALEPYRIALRDLTIVAANASVSDPKLTLDNDSYPVREGILLKGELAFTDGSAAPLFQKRFECLFFGEAPAPSATPLPPRSDARAETLLLAYRQEKPEEARNNVEVGRTFGPVTFRKARFETRRDPRGDRIYLLLDASIGAGGIGLDLYEFNLNFPMADLTKLPPENLKNLEVGLDGFGISYAKPPLTINGGLMWDLNPDKDGLKPGEVIEYAYGGHLLIKAANFQIGVIGQYALIAKGAEKTSSLFIFGTFRGILGGPPAFFITGLALGGGYNSRLTIPAVEEIHRFPLITAVVSPETFKETDLKGKITPSPGDYWLAVGVRFTSFKIADSFALFSVAFGNRLQFALTGLTKLQLPPPDAKYVAVYAELALRAVLDPQAGVLSLEARLTDNSYVFHKELRLTGGFAFFVWFGNHKEAGDFVISLGGYHPLFKPKAHYPVVPRLRIGGQLGGLSVAGEAYFALTPSCVMGGIRFEAVFAEGRLRAAFLAYADFIMAWAPFAYKADMGIALAISYNFSGSAESGGGLTIKLELGADLHIWGPPFAGVATITYWILSATVRFGDQSGQKAELLEWPAFQTRFLSHGKPGKETPVLCTIRVTEGVMREVKDQAVPDKTHRIVNPHEIMIETDSAVPCTTVSLGTASKSLPAASRVGIRPMGAEKLTSTHKVEIKKKAGDDVTGNFMPVRWATKNFPEALWSHKPASGAPEAEMVKEVPSGVVLRVQPTKPQHRLGPFPIAAFEYDLVQHKDSKRGKKIALDGRLAPDKPDNTETEGISKVLDDSKGHQGEVLAYLQQGSQNSDLHQIKISLSSANVNQHFRAPPRCATLGSPLAKAHQP